MKRLLFINSNQNRMPYPVIPIGLCMVADSVKDKYEIEFYDAAFDKKLKNFPNTLKEFKPDYILLTIRNVDSVTGDKRIFYLDNIKEKIIDIIRKFSKSPIILGGSGFSILPKEIMKFTDADYGIIGEGENKLLLLLEGIESNKIPEVQEIISKESINLNFKKQIDYIDISSSFNTVQIEKYIDIKSYFKDDGVYPIQTKRGCPIECSYCVYPRIEGKSYRLRKIKDIVDEIENVTDRINFNKFEFVDSVFNTPIDFAKDICREIIKRKLKVKLFASGINPVNVDEELIELMLGSGFEYITCTPDSASSKIIDLLKKRFTFEQLQKTAEIIKKYNLPTVWDFLIGGPRENVDSINETFEFIKKYISKIDSVMLSFGIRIYPNTDLYNICIDEGYLTKEDSLLKPIFYVSKELGVKGEFRKLILNKVKYFPNCASMSTVSDTPKSFFNFIVNRVNKIQKNIKIEEPFFRTMNRVKNVIYNKKGKVKQLDFLRELLLQSFGYNNKALLNLKQ